MEGTCLTTRRICSFPVFTIQASKNIVEATWKKHLTELSAAAEPYFPAVTTRESAAITIQRAIRKHLRGTYRHWQLGARSNVFALGSPLDLELREEAALKIQRTMCQLFGGNISDSVSGSMESYSNSDEQLREESSQEECVDDNSAEAAAVRRAFMASTMSGPCSPSPVGHDDCWT